MSQLVDVFRARIAPDQVARLLEVRPRAIEDMQARIPELLRADLVQLDDGVWLDVLVWSGPVEEARVMAAAAASQACGEMHRIAGDVVGWERGTLAHTLGRA